MKKLTRQHLAAAALILSLMLCLTGSLIAQAEDSEVVLQPGRLEVRGQAIRIVMPDTVDITIGVTAHHNNEQGAFSEANTVIGNVIESLKALNVPENQIKTNRLDVSPRYETRFTKRELVGYTASVSLRVTLKDFEMINTVIDTSVAHGANNIGGMQFSFSEEGLAYRQALADATKIAREKAEILAEAAGIELGTVLLLRESGSNAYSVTNAYAPMEADSAGSGGGAQVMSGEMQITASIELVYETK